MKRLAPLFAHFRLYQDDIRVIKCAVAPSSDLVSGWSAQKSHLLGNVMIYKKGESNMRKFEIQTQADIDFAKDDMGQYEGEITYKGENFWIPAENLEKFLDGVSWLAGIYGRDSLDPVIRTPGLAEELVAAVWSILAGRELVTHGHLVDNTPADEEAELVAD
jgi:hypothetical protein